MEDYTILKKLKEETKTKIKEILDDGIQQGNLDNLSKLVDIYEDVKEDKSMRYREYNNYNNYNGYGNYGRNSYGENSYGRRGYDAKYRGHEHLDRMSGEYSRYEDGREQYNRGNYSAKEDSMICLENMLESMVDFVKMLKEEASSQEEVNLIQEYTRRISEM